MVFSFSPWAQSSSAFAIDKSADTSTSAETESVAIDDQVSEVTDTALVASDSAEPAALEPSASENAPDALGASAAAAAATVTFAVDNSEGSFADTTLATEVNADNGDETDYVVTTTTGSALPQDQIPEMTAASDGYEFASWVVYDTDGTTVKATYTASELAGTTITADTTFHATFKQSEVTETSSSTTTDAAPSESALTVQSEDAPITPQATNVASVTTSGGVTTNYTTLESAFAAATSGSTVKLLANCTTTAKITINTATTLTLDGAGYTITRGFTGNMFQLDNTSATLSVGNVTIDGAASTGFMGSVFDMTNGTLNVTAGTTIQNNKKDGAYQAAIGIFNTSRVNLYANTKIINNTSNAGGGVGIVMYDNTNLYMIGGLISGNNGGDSGGGIQLRGNAVAHLYGGEISANYCDVPVNGWTWAGGGIACSADTGTAHVEVGGTIVVKDNYQKTSGGSYVMCNIGGTTKNTGTGVSTSRFYDSTYNSPITISSSNPPKAGAQIGVYDDVAYKKALLTTDSYTSGNPYQVTTGGTTSLTNAQKSYFTSDNGYTVKWGNDITSTYSQISTTDQKYDIWFGYPLIQWKLEVDNDGASDASRHVTFSGGLRAQTTGADTQATMSAISPITIKADQGYVLPDASNTEVVKLTTAGLTYTLSEDKSTATISGTLTNNATPVTIAATASASLNNVFIGSTTATNNSSGVAASDSNSGNTPSTAVATFARAKALLKAGGTIWVVGPVAVSGTETWDLNNYGTGGTGAGLMKRWDGTSVSFTQAANKVAYNTNSMVIPSGTSANLTMTNIVLDGNSSSTSVVNNGKDAVYEGQIISVMSGAKTTLGSGTTLQKNYNKHSVGYGAYGGAVYIGASGVVDMVSGATISDCHGDWGGAVFATSGSTFNMTGGTVTGCSALNSNAKSASIRSMGGTLNLSGGTITGNTGHYAVTVDNSAGVLNLSGTINISGNTAGGVDKEEAGATVNISGGATVKNNTPSGSTVQKNLNIQTAGDKVNVTGALAGSIGVTVKSADHVVLHEFAQGSSYTTTTSDADRFSDDYANALRIENKADVTKVSTDNAIRFSGTYVCKIVTNGVATPYYTLAAALAVAKTATTDTTIEMLVENYTENAQETVAQDNGKTITITTASPTATDGYKYTGTTGTYSTIKRNATYGSMFSLTSGNLAFKNINVDGNKSSYNSTENGGLVKVASGCTFDMQSGSTLENGVSNLITGGTVLAQYGGGVYLSSGASMTMEDGALAKNCTALRYGGFLYQETNTTFTATGGQMNDNTATGTTVTDPSGGAIMQNPDGTNITTTLGGNFSATGNQTNYNGSFIHGGKNSTCSIVIKDSASITGNACTSSTNNYGGAVYNYGANVKVQGSPTVTGNTKAGISANSDIRLNNNTSLVVTGDLTGGKIGIYSDGYYAVGQDFGTSTSTSSTVKGLYHLVNDRNTALLGCADGTATTNVMWGLRSTSTQGYTIHFDGNGSTSGSMADESMTYGTEGTLTANAFTRDGYTFNGWNTVATPTTATPGTAYADKATSAEFTNVYDTATVTLYAQWSINSYTLTFDANGHGTAPASQTVTYGAKATAPTAPTAAGYTFGGWYTEAACTNAVDFSTWTMPSADTTLYAKWTEDSNVTLAFAPDATAHGSVDTPSEALAPATGTATAVTATANPGYTFSKWTYTDATHTTATDVTGATSATITAGQIDSAAKDTGIYEATSFIANFTENSGYTVAYDLNYAGATNPDSKLNVKWTDTGLLPAAPTRDGYTFAGWNTVAAPTAGTPGIAVDAATTFAAAAGNAEPAGGTVTLYAQWTANTDTAYTVEHYKVNAAGNAATLVDADTQHSSGTTDTTATATPKTYAGYTYQPNFDQNGMKTVASGTIAGDGSLVLKLYYTPNTNTTYKVYYNRVKNDGNTLVAFSEVDKTGTTGTTVDFDVLGAATTFAGYDYTSSKTTYKDTDHGTAQTTALPIAGDGSLVVNLYYVEKADVALTFQPESATKGSVSTGSQMLAPESGTATAVAATANAGYTFSNWSNNLTGATTTDATLTKTQINAVAKSSGVYVPTTFTANFTENSDYIVAYNLNYAGSAAPASKTGVLWSGTGLLPTPAPTRDGYTLSGWNTIAAPTAGTPGIAVDATTTFAAAAGNAEPAGKTVTLYAQWTVNNYTVHFDANNGTGTMDDESFTYDTAQALTTNAFTRDGYTFMGWNTVATPTAGNPGTSYTDGQSVNNLTTTAGGSVTLYAQWQATSITATNKVVTVTQAKALTNDGTSVTDAALISANSVTASVAGAAVTATVEAISPTTGKSDIHSGTLGTYTVTYTAGTGTSKVTTTANITVVPDDSVINGTDAAYAGTKIYSSSDAKNVSLQTDLYAAQGCYGAYQGNAVSAADMPGNANVSQSITSGDWAKIKAGTLGSYDSNITVGSATSTGGKVIVVPDGSVITDTNSVSAQSTILTVSQAKALATAADGAKLMYGSTLDANATRIYNNVSGYVAGVAGTTDTISQAFANAGDWASITAGDLGTYGVTYTAGSGASAASKAVTITVVPDGSVIGPTTDGDDAIYSKTILMKSAAAITAFGTSASSRDLMAPAYNDVHAVLDGYTIADPQADDTHVTQTIAAADWTAIKSGTVGSYIVTYACGDAAPQKVRVIIIKNEATQNGDNAVVANSVTLKSSDAKNLASATTLYGESYNYVEGYYADSNHADIDIVNNADAIANASNTPGTAGAITQYAADGTTLLSASTAEWTNGIKAGETGTYQVKYSITGQDTSQTDRTAVATVNVTVVPDDSVVVANTGDAVYARTYLTTSAAAIADFASATSDILYGASTTSPSTDYNRVLISKDDTILFDSSTPTRKAASTQTIASTDWAKIQAGTTGAYDVSYKVTGDDASAKAVQVIVLPDGSVIDPATNLAVYGKTVTINASTAKALTQQSQLYGSAYNNVTAVKDGTLITTANLPTETTQTINAADWTKIQTGTTGSYDVTYKVTSAKDTTKSVSTTGVKVIVVPDDTTIDPTTNDTVTASTIVIDQTTAKGLSTTDLYGSTYNNVSGNIAGVAITDPLTGITQYASDNATLLSASTEWTDGIKAGVVGTYPVTYANLNGKTLENTVAKRTVNVIVVPDGSVISGTDSAYAGAKVYTVEDAMALTNKTDLYAAQSANATSKGTAVTIAQMVAGTAVNGQTVKQTIGNTDWSSITSGTLGTYTSNIELDNASGSAVVTSTTGKVTVVPNGSVINGTDAIYGKTVTLNQTQAKALLGSEKTVLEGSSYNAVDATYQGTRLSASTNPTLLATVTANISNDDWAKVTSGTIGSYDSNYTCGTATTTGVKVIVVSDDTVVNGNNSITASSTIVTASNAKNVLGAAANTEGSKILFGTPLSTTAGTETYNKVSGYINGVAATTENDLAQTINATDWQSITAGTLGTYSVSYAAGTGTDAAVKAVTVTVVPDGSVISGTNSAYADVKVYTQQQATALAKTDLYAGQSANATSLGQTVTNAQMVAGTAVNGQTVKQTITADDWASVKAGTVGSYDSNIEVDNASGVAQVTSTGGKVIVVPDGSVVTGTDAAYAGVKTYTVSEAKALTGKTVLYEAQGCYGAYQGTAIAAADMASNAHVSQGISNASWTSITNGDYGSYDSNITIGTATSNTGKVIVIPDGSVIDPSTNTSVSAETVTLTPAEAIALTAVTDLYGSTLNNVSGYIDGTAIAAGDVTTSIVQTFANDGGWAAIKAGKLGTYSVTYTVTSVADPTKTAAKTVHVIVADNSGNTGGVICTADDFWLQKDATPTDTELVADAQAIGYDTTTIPDTALTAEVNSRGSLDTSKTGSYPDVSFKATSGTTTAIATVTATVKDAVDKGAEYEISANDFELSIDEATALNGGSGTTLTADARSGVAARDIKTHAPAGWHSDYSAVKAAAGVYDVTYTSNDDPTASVTVKCTVKDSVTETDGIVVSGNTVYLSTAQTALATSPTDINALVLANAAATAKRLDTGAALTPAVDSTTTPFGANAAKGTYGATLSASYNDGTEHTATTDIQVIVTDTVVTDNGVMVGGHKAVISTSEAADATNLPATLKERSGEFGKVIATGADATTVAAANSNLKADKGLYTAGAKLTATNPADASKTASANVDVLVTDNVVTDNGETIWANDFSISLADAQTCTFATAVKLSGAGAMVTATGAPVDLDEALSDITAVTTATAPGIVDITFTTAAGTTVNAKVHIMDNGSVGDSYAIAANNFMLAKNSTFDDAGLIAKALATGTKLSDGSASTVLVSDKSALDTSNDGQYPVSFVTPDATTTGNASTTVTVTVKDDVTVDPDNDETIGANDFYISLAEANALAGDDTDLATLSPLASPSAYVTSTGEPVAIVGVVDTDLQAATGPGSYDVTFSTAKGSSVTVKGIIKDSVTTTQGVTIAGNTVYLSTAQTAAVTTSDAINALVLDNASAVAKRLDTGAALTPTVDSTTTPFGANAAEGTYGATLSASYNDGTDDHTAATDINVVVADHVVATDSYLISASDFVVQKGTMPDDEMIVAASNAQGKVKSTGAATTVTVTDKSALEAGYNAKGAYDVSLAAPDGTTTGNAATTVKATVKDQVVDIEGTTIAANDFSIGTNQVAGLTDAIVNKLAGTTAYKTATHAAVNWTADYSSVKDIPGAYDVTFTATDGSNATVTVKCTVTGSGEQNDFYSITANDFMLAKGSTPDDATLIADAVAKGTNLSDGSASTVVVDDNKVVDTSKAGTFQLKFDTPAKTDDNAVSTTVTVTVKDVVTPNEDNDETVGANDFYISLADANALTDPADSSDLLALTVLAGAHAQVTSTGVPVAINAAKTTDLKNATGNGSYDVTFSTAKGSSATVKGIIKDYVAVENGVTVAGNTVYLSTAQAASATSADEMKALVLAGTSAVAKRLDTGAALEPSVDSTNTPFGSNAAQGTYSADLSASYKDSGGTTHTATTNIKVVVADHVGTSDKYVITANDFMVAKDSTMTDTDQIDAANATGTLRSTGALSPVVLESSALDTSAKGIYDVVFDTPDATNPDLATTTVQATVKDSVNIDTDNGETIGANNFSISLTQANALTDSNIPELIALAAAKAYKTSDGSAVAITSVDYSTLKAATEISGPTYPVTFMTDAGTVVTVQATVTDSSTYDPDSGESISGDDYTITPDQAATIIAGGAAGKALAISSGQVTATDVATGTPIDIATVDASKLSTTPGTYPVNYATAAGTDVTLYATVAGDNTTVDPDTHEAIDAADFTIDTVVAKNLTNDQIVALSGARAWSTKDGSAVDITSIDSMVQGVAGTYAVTFTTAAGTTRTITVTVVDVKPVSVDPPVTKQVKGDAPAGTYTFKMTAGDVSYPMPSGSSNGVKEASITMSAGAQSAQSVEFGTITYTEPGTYTYTLSEVAGDDANMAYDATAYSIKVVVTDEDGSLQAVKTITDGTGKSVDTAAYVNTYTTPANTPASNLPKTSDPAGAMLPYLAIMLIGGCLVIIVSRRRNRSARGSEERSGSEK